MWYVSSLTIYILKLHEIDAPPIDVLSTSPGVDKAMTFSSFHSKVFSQSTSKLFAFSGILFLVSERVKKKKTN